MTQSEFLQSAMTSLGMTRDEFAARLGCPRRTLDKWLLPESSNDHRGMPEVVWTLVREILANEKLLAKVERLEKKLVKIS
jgi:transcriptional regulator with XRE-family HTH domain